MGVLDKRFNTLLGLHVFVDTPSGGGSTTISAAAAAGASTLVLTSATNFAIGDDIRVGTGETSELVRISNLVTLTVTTAKPLKFDHPVAEPVVEQSAISLGTPEADGFRLRFNGETTDVFAATQRLPYGTLTGFVDLGASWRYPVVTADVLALAFGIPRANIIGNGTAAAQSGTVGPRLWTTDGTLFGTITNVNIVATGQLQDGTYLKVDLYNVTFDPTAVTTTFARGQLATVPVRVLASSGAIDDTNTLFTPANTVQTFASSKGDIFSEITAVETLTDSGTATTTTATIAAGAYVIPVTSATGIVAGDYLRLGVGDAAEYHLVHSVVSLNLNLRTQVLRAHASGVAVVKSTRTALSVAQGGFTFGTSGSVETQRSETFRTSLAYRSSNIAVTLSCNLDAITALNYALALGIPTAQYANNVLPLGAQIGKATAVTLLFRGLTQDGKTASICGWNGTVNIGGETQFTQAAAAQIPVSFKASVLQTYVNA